MTNEQRIQEVAATVFDVNPTAVSVDHRLMGGMSNYTYVFTVNDEKFTFRIPGKNAEKFVDRDIEKTNIKIVDKLGLNNDTVYLDVASGMKIARYLEGQPLSTTDPLGHLIEAAYVLHRIHDSELRAVNDYNPQQRLARYEGHLAEFDFDHSDRYNNLKARWMAQRDAYVDPSRWTLCHGDSQISNFVVTDDGLRLMDWEFTGNNDPFYDIACFGNNDFGHALALLPVYLGHEPSVEDYNRLYFYRAYQCLQWHNVALYKEFIGLSVDLGVDFAMVANLYLDKTEKFLNSIK